MAGLKAFSYLFYAAVFLKKDITFHAPSDFLLVVLFSKNVFFMRYEEYRVCGISCIKWVRCVGPILMYIGKAQSCGISGDRFPPGGTP